MNRSRKRRAQRVRTILMAAGIAVAAAVSAMLYMRQRVTDTYASDDSQTVESEAVTKGSLTTTVSGSGTLEAVGTEDITMPSGVEIGTIYHSEGEKVSEGDLLFSVDQASVLSAMKDIQDQIDTLDESLESAQSDEVSESLTSGVSGRVKKIYAEADDDVAQVMYDSGALLTLSLDGYMAVDVDTDLLSAGDEVNVTASDGTSYTGTVDQVTENGTVILITDDGPADGEEVTVTFDAPDDADSAAASGASGSSKASDEAESSETSDTAGSSGTEASEETTDTSSEQSAESDSEDTGTVTVTLTGTLCIHSPLSVTGYAGTVSSVDVSENESVDADTTLLTLTDTSYSSNYDTILEKRNDLEEDLETLIKLYREGGVYAPFSGIIDSVSDDYTDYVMSSGSSSSEENSSGTAGTGETDIEGASGLTENGSVASAVTEDTDKTGAASSVLSTAAAAASSDTASAVSGTESSSASGSSDDDITVLTLDPDEQMTVSVSVDETDILSLKKGQSASVTIDSIGEDSFQGTVTDIDTSAESSSGVTSYLAEVTISRTDDMLAGMSADVSITIDGVENALLVPSEAVHQTSSTSYVYTSYNEETGEYSGMTEVTTGMTDGTDTEILSGLNEGDIVYYEKSQTQQDDFPGMGGFSMPSGDSDMSSGGGQMPSGGGPSGNSGDSDSSGGGFSMPSGGGQMPSGGPGTS